VNHTELPNSSQIKPTKVSSLTYYSEGPVIDSSGDLYISHGDSISKLIEERTLITWTTTTAPNGHKILPNGNHLVCDGKHSAVLLINQNGKIIGKAASGSYKDLEITSPNDLCLHPNGGFYFTDSLPKVGVVYYVSQAKTIHVLARNLDVPNGIALSENCRQLFVSESYTNRILLFEIDEKGMASSAPKVFSNLPRNQKKGKDAANMPDGIALDADGRLWVAHYGMHAIQVLSPEGELLATYDTGIRCTSNICFGGKNLTTAFVTGGEGEPTPGALIRLDVGVPGLSVLR
jgi:gluconolactonase